MAEKTREIIHGDPWEFHSHVMLALQLPISTYKLSRLISLHSRSKLFPKEMVLAIAITFSLDYLLILFIRFWEIAHPPLP